MGTKDQLPSDESHLATPTLHPTWFTHQVSLSYLQFGPVTCINNTPKSLSNSKTYIVTETYELVTPRFKERIPQLGERSHVMSCQSMPWSLSSLLSNNWDPCTRITTT